MSVANSILVALIVMLIVFVCLIALSLLLKLQSFIFGYVDKNKKVQVSKKEVTSTKGHINSEISTGELELTGVDEKTTAIIMAIVSDELKVPLCELQFKSIKLIREANLK
jgi:hypothetical protein